MFFSKKIFLTTAIVFLGLGGVSHAATLPSFRSVVKVVAYQEQPMMDGAYQEYSYGSAVAISHDKLLTNAHVILDDEYEPIEYLAICVTDDAFVVPDCPTVATVLDYDVDKDIALLEVVDSIDIDPIVMADGNLALGDHVQVLGYPSNGGGTITLTQGTISGKDTKLYKIDANLDGGNSGGGAFNEYGELIGMPVSVSVGYTTLGYMISVEDIGDFLSQSLSGDDLSVIESDFEEYISGMYDAKVHGIIDNDFFSFEGFGAYGYNLQQSSVLPQMGSYTYAFSSLDEQSHIIVSASPYKRAPGDMIDNIGVDIDQLHKVRKRVIYKEDISLLGHSWSLLYVDGYKRSNEPSKELYLVHDDGDYLYTYIVQTSTESDEDFIRALRVLFSGYVIHQYEGTPVDVREFGDLLFSDTLTISNPQSDGEGVEVSLSYHDAVYGEASYYVVNDGMIDMLSIDEIESDSMCDWMEGDGCEDFWLRNKNNILMNIVTYENQGPDELSYDYQATIIDQYDEDYVIYDISLTVEGDDYTHKERVEDFLNSIDGNDIDWVFDEYPEDVQENR